MHYQPIVRVSDRRVVGLEALVRLRDDLGALVYPLDLLQHGTPPGDIAGEIMHQAMADVARWVARGHDLWLSLNVSAQQVGDIEELSAGVALALQRTGLSPDRLVLELTEHTLLPTDERTLTGIRDLVATGVRLSIDDFGTDYGSLVYLQALPVDELKINRSFVTQAPTSPAAKAIMRSIAALAADLGLRCVAEGVECLAQHEVVRSTGVPLAQGLEYADALDAEAMMALLEGERALTGPPS